MFVDKAVIKVKAGDGGHGCCSFRREKYVPKGGPDGGDGGAGGNVYIEASPNESSLAPYMYMTSYRAKNGPGGQGSDMHGRKAPDIVLQVPVGTVVTNRADGVVAADLDTAGVRVLLAKGGRGGRGNARFVSNFNRVPRFCEAGKEGEEFELELELKIIADAGLVGYPNAGKSTLLGMISAAKPKVAAYPFTTLNPVVGVVDYDDYQRVTVADIPGLIEGAHDNVGLGHAFLKHIERTSALVYVLDMGGSDGRDPLADLASLRRELELYMNGLSARPALIVANKMDLEEAPENLERLRNELASEVIDIVPVTAALGELGELKNILRRNIENARRAAEFKLDR